MQIFYISATILINRGWVPRDKVNPKNRQDGQIKDTVTLTGVIRTTEKVSCLYCDCNCK